MSYQALHERYQRIGHLEWLRANVHSRGSLLPTMAVVAEATGGELGTTAFLGHLNERYGA